MLENLAKKKLSEYQFDGDFSNWCSSVNAVISSQHLKPKQTGRVLLFTDFCLEPRRMYVRSLQGSSSFNFSVLRRDSFFRMQFYKFIELNCHFVCFAVFNQLFKSQKCLRDSQRVFPAKTISTTLNIDLFKVPVGVKPAFPITASALKK